jgi:hypothetical protein
MEKIAKLRRIGWIFVGIEWAFLIAQLLLHHVFDADSIWVTLSFGGVLLFGAIGLIIFCIGIIRNSKLKKDVRNKADSQINQGI